LLPFTHPEWNESDKTLKVKAQIGGGPVGEFTVDTGSVGMIVGADEIPHIDPGAKPGQITYSSSGVQLRGVWTSATVTFPDAKGAHGVATAVVPVLAVKSEVCLGVGVNAEHCHALPHPHPHMLGIGFGRGQESHPEKNAFLNLDEMRNGTMRRGYCITHHGIMLGLTAKTIEGGFVWQKLASREVSAETAALSPNLRDWETASGSFQVGGLASGEGTVLIDTGLTNMMLASPNETSRADIADGTSIQVDLLGGQLHYSFKVGDSGNPAVPRRVTWIRATHGIFINTGLHALANFDYLFDADGGWLALRPRNR
jgi:hypothetical protein